MRAAASGLQHREASLHVEDKGTCRFEAACVSQLLQTEKLTEGAPRENGKTGMRSQLGSEGHCGHADKDIGRGIQSRIQQGD